MCFTQEQWLSRGQSKCPTIYIGPCALEIEKTDAGKERDTFLVFELKEEGCVCLLVLWWRIVKRSTTPINGPLLLWQQWQMLFSIHLSIPWVLSSANPSRVSQFLFSGKNFTLCLYFRSKSYCSGIWHSMIHSRGYLRILDLMVLSGRDYLIIRIIINE